MDGVVSCKNCMILSSSVFSIGIILRLLVVMELWKNFVLVHADYREGPVSDQNIIFIFCRKAFLF